VESVENSNNKNEFPTLSTGLGNPAKNKTPDSHISTAPAADLHKKKENQGGTKTKFQLTDHGHFTHHDYASVATLRT